MSCNQVCSAGSRLIVQETIADEIVAKIKERLTHFRVGDSLDKVCRTCVGLHRHASFDVHILLAVCGHGSNYSSFPT